MRKTALATFAILLTACQTPTKDSTQIVTPQDLFGEWQCSTTKSLYDRNEELFTFHKNGSYEMEGVNMHSDLIKLGTSSQGLWTLHGNELTIISQKGTVVRKHSEKGQKLLKKDKDLSRLEKIAFSVLEQHLNSAIPSALTIFGKGKDPHSGKYYILMRPTQEQFELVINCTQTS